MAGRPVKNDNSKQFLKQCRLTVVENRHNPYHYGLAEQRGTGVDLELFRIEPHGGPFVVIKINDLSVPALQSFFVSLLETFFSDAAYLFADGSACRCLFCHNDVFDALRRWPQMFHLRRYEFSVNITIFYFAGKEISLFICKFAFMFHIKPMSIMKKFLCIFALAAMTAVAANAQPRAIGGRIGSGIGFTYQHSVGGDNMISADLDFPLFNGGISATATYDWIFPINSWTEKGSWNWYAGAGAGLGFGWPHTEKVTAYGVTGRSHAGSFNIGVTGRIGVEYNFWFPLQLSLDWRPTIGPGIVWNNTSVTMNGETTRENNTSVVFNTGGLYAGSICLGVRYLF